jgi:transposase
MIEGTKSEEIIYALEKIPFSERKKVEEITMDLSPTMRIVAEKVFPLATIVIDRFHVQKLVHDVVSDIRIKYRWQVIAQENKEIALAKECKKKFIPELFKNGDTRRQLLARSRLLLMKHYSKWTNKQAQRAEILFNQYPEIKNAYDIAMQLTNIYNTSKKQKYC